MSSYSFSPQFSQRWTRAPDSVRAAIVQELKDITSLLQTKTPFEDFEFSTHDLDAHLDELYDAHAAEQAAEKQRADKQAAEQEAAEQAQRAKEKQIAEQQAKALAESQRKETELKQQQTAQKEQNKKDAERDSNAANDIEQEQKPDNGSNISTDSRTDVKASTNNDDVQNTISKPLKGAAIDLAVSDPKLSATHEGLISELEVQVDDYLSEQMLQISEDLKSWLRSEVARQLAGMTENKTKTQNEPATKAEIPQNLVVDKSDDKQSAER